MATLQVSIRARHCWRAMPVARMADSASSMFQSAPAIAGGRCVVLCSLTAFLTCFNPRPPLLAGDAHPRPAGLDRAYGFNPRPPLLAGDALRTRPMRWRWRCFNPRPPLLAGDARTRRASHGRTHGFNPRPPLLAGDAVQLALAGLGVHVSIRARHCWRAMPDCVVWATLFLPFQSAPAIAGGRCIAQAMYSAFCKVSIRARHCWRAMRAA